jgi:hypothetical protein
MDCLNPLVLSPQKKKKKKKILTWQPAWARALAAWSRPDPPGWFRPKSCGVEKKLRIDLKKNTHRKKRSLSSEFLCPNCTVRW